MSGHMPMRVLLGRATLSILLSETTCWGFSSESVARGEEHSARHISSSAAGHVGSFAGELPSGAARLTHLRHERQSESVQQNTGSSDTLPASSLSDGGNSGEVRESTEFLPVDNSPHRCDRGLDGEVRRGRKSIEESEATRSLEHQQWFKRDAELVRAASSTTRSSLRHGADNEQGFGSREKQDIQPHHLVRLESDHRQRNRTAETDVTPPQDHRKNQQSAEDGVPTVFDLAPKNYTAVQFIQYDQFQKTSGIETQRQRRGAGDVHPLALLQVQQRERYRLSGDWVNAGYGGTFYDGYGPGTGASGATPVAQPTSQQGGGGIDLNAGLRAAAGQATAEGANAASGAFQDAAQHTADAAVEAVRYAQTDPRGAAAHAKDWVVEGTKGAYATFGGFSQIQAAAKGFQDTAWWLQHPEKWQGAIQHGLDQFNNAPWQMKVILALEVGLTVAAPVCAGVFIAEASAPLMLAVGTTLTEGAGALSMAEWGTAMGSTALQAVLGDFYQLGELAFIKGGKDAAVHWTKHAEDCFGKLTPEEETLAKALMRKELFQDVVELNRLEILMKKSGQLLTHQPLADEVREGLVTEVTHTLRTRLDGVPGEALRTEALENAAARHQGLEDFFEHPQGSVQENVEETVANSVKNLDTFRDKVQQDSGKFFQEMNVASKEHAYEAMQGAEQGLSKAIQGAPDQLSSGWKASANGVTGLLTNPSDLNLNMNGIADSGVDLVEDIGGKAGKLAEPHAMEALAVAHGLRREANLLEDKLILTDKERKLYDIFLNGGSKEDELKKIDDAVVEARKSAAEQQAKLAEETTHKINSVFAEKQKKLDDITKDVKLNEKGELPPDQQEKMLKDAEKLKEELDEQHLKEIAENKQNLEELAQDTEAAITHQGDEAAKDLQRNYDELRDEVPEMVARVGADEMVGAVGRTFDNELATFVIKWTVRGVVELGKLVGKFVGAILKPLITAVKDLWQRVMQSWARGASEAKLQTQSSSVAARGVDVMGARISLLEKVRTDLVDGDLEKKLKDLQKQIVQEAGAQGSAVDAVSLESTLTASGLRWLTPLAAGAATANLYHLGGDGPLVDCTDFTKKVQTLAKDIRAPSSASNSVVRQPFARLETPAEFVVLRSADLLRGGALTASGQRERLMNDLNTKMSSLSSPSAGEENGDLTSTGTTPATDEVSRSSVAPAEPAVAASFLRRVKETLSGSCGVHSYLSPSFGHNKEVEDAHPWDSVDLWIGPVWSEDHSASRDHARLQSKLGVAAENSLPTREACRQGVTAYAKADEDAQEWQRKLTHCWTDRSIGHLSGTAQENWLPPVVFDSYALKDFCEDIMGTFRKSEDELDGGPLHGCCAAYIRDMDKNGPASSTKSSVRTAASHGSAKGGSGNLLEVDNVPTEVVVTLDLLNLPEIELESVSDVGGTADSAAQNMQRVERVLAVQPQSSQSATGNDRVLKPGDMIYDDHVPEYFFVLLRNFFNQQDLGRHDGDADTFCKKEKDNVGDVGPRSSRFTLLRRCAKSTAATVKPETTTSTSLLVQMRVLRPLSTKVPGANNAADDAKWKERIQWNAMRCDVVFQVFRADAVRGFSQSECPEMTYVLHYTNLPPKSDSKLPSLLQSYCSLRQLQQYGKLVTLSTRSWMMALDSEFQTGRAEHALALMSSMDTDFLRKAFTSGDQSKEKQKQMKDEASRIRAYQSQIKYEFSKTSDAVTHEITLQYLDMMLDSWANKMMSTSWPGGGVLKQQREFSTSPPVTEATKRVEQQAQSSRALLDGLGLLEMEHGLLLLAQVLKELNKMLDVSPSPSSSGWFPWLSKGGKKTDDHNDLDYAISELLSPLAVNLPMGFMKTAGIGPRIALGQERQSLLHTKQLLELVSLQTKGLLLPGIDQSAYDYAGFSAIDPWATSANTERVQEDLKLKAKLLTREEVGRSSSFQSAAAGDGSWFEKGITRSLKNSAAVVRRTPQTSSSQKDSDPYDKSSASDCASAKKEQKELVFGVAMCSLMNMKEKQAWTLDSAMETPATLMLYLQAKESELDYKRRKLQSEIDDLKYSERKARAKGLLPAGKMLSPVLNMDIFSKSAQQRMWKSLRDYSSIEVALQQVGNNQMNLVAEVQHHASHLSEDLQTARETGEVAGRVGEAFIRGATSEDQAAQPTSFLARRPDLVGPPRADELIQQKGQYVLGKHLNTTTNSTSVLPLPAEILTPVLLASEESSLGNIIQRSLGIRFLYDMFYGASKMSTNVSDTPTSLQNRPRLRGRLRRDRMQHVAMIGEAPLQRPSETNSTNVLPASAIPLVDVSPGITGSLQPELATAKEVPALDWVSWLLSTPTSRDGRPRAFLAPRVAKSTKPKEKKEEQEQPISPSDEVANHERGQEGRPSLIPTSDNLMSGAQEMRDGEEIQRIETVRRSQKEGAAIGSQLERLSSRESSRGRQQSTDGGAATPGDGVRLANYTTSLKNPDDRDFPAPREVFGTTSPETNSEELGSESTSVPAPDEIDDRSFLQHGSSNYKDLWGTGTAIEETEKLTEMLTILHESLQKAGDVPAGTGEVARMWSKVEDVNLLVQSIAHDQTLKQAIEDKEQECSTFPASMQLLLGKESASGEAGGQVAAKEDVDALTEADLDSLLLWGFHDLKPQLDVKDHITSTEIKIPPQLQLVANNPKLKGRLFNRLENKIGQSNERMKACRLLNFWKLLVNRMRTVYQRELVADFASTHHTEFLAMFVKKITFELASAMDLDEQKGWLSLSQRSRWKSLLEKIGNMLINYLYPEVLCASRMLFQTASALSAQGNINGAGPTKTESVDVVEQDPTTRILGAGKQISKALRLDPLRSASRDASTRLQKRKILRLQKIAGEAPADPQNRLSLLVDGQLQPLHAVFLWEGGVGKLPYGADFDFMDKPIALISSEGQDTQDQAQKKERVDFHNRIEKYHNSKLGEESCRGPVDNEKLSALILASMQVEPGQGTMSVQSIANTKSKVSEFLKARAYTLMAAWNELHDLLVMAAAKLLENRIIRSQTLEFELFSEAELAGRLSGFEEVVSEKEAGGCFGGGGDEADANANAESSEQQAMVVYQQPTSPRAWGFSAILENIKAAALSLAGSFVALLAYGAISVFADASVFQTAGITSGDAAASTVALNGSGKAFFSEALIHMRNALWNLIGYPLKIALASLLRSVVSSTGTGQGLFLQALKGGISLISWLKSLFQTSAWQVWAIRNPMRAELLQMLWDVLTHTFSDAGWGIVRSGFIMFLFCEVGVGLAAVTAGGALGGVFATVSVASGGTAGAVAAVGCGAGLVGHFTGAVTAAFAACSSFGLKAGIIQAVVSGGQHMIKFATHLLYFIGNQFLRLVFALPFGTNTFGGSSPLKKLQMRAEAKDANNWFSKGVYGVLKHLQLDTTRDPDAMKRRNRFGSIIAGLIALLLMIFSGAVTDVMSQLSPLAAGAVTIPGTSFINAVNIPLQVFVSATAISTLMATWGWVLAALFRKAIAALLNIPGRIWSFLSSRWWRKSRDAQNPDESDQYNDDTNLEPLSQTSKRIMGIAVMSSTTVLHLDGDACLHDVIAPLDPEVTGFQPLAPARAGAAQSVPAECDEWELFPASGLGGTAGVEHAAGAGAPPLCTTTDAETGATRSSPFLKHLAKLQERLFLEGGDGPTTKAAVGAETRSAPQSEEDSSTVVRLKGGLIPHLHDETGGSGAGKSQQEDSSKRDDTGPSSYSSSFVGEGGAASRMRRMNFLVKNIVVQSWKQGDRLICRLGTEKSIFPEMARIERAMAAESLEKSKSQPRDPGAVPSSKQGQLKQVLLLSLSRKAFKQNESSEWGVVSSFQAEGDLPSSQDEQILKTGGTSAEDDENMASADEQGHATGVSPPSFFKEAREVEKLKDVMEAVQQEQQEEAAENRRLARVREDAAAAAERDSRPAEAKGQAKPKSQPAHQRLQGNPARPLSDGFRGRPPIPRRGDAGAEQRSSRTHSASLAGRSISPRSDTGRGGSAPARNSATTARATTRPSFHSDSIHLRARPSSLSNGRFHTKTDYDSSVSGTTAADRRRRGAADGIGHGVDHAHAPQRTTAPNARHEGSNAAGATSTTPAGVGATLAEAASSGPPVAANSAQSVSSAKAKGTPSTTLLPPFPRRGGSADASRRGPSPSADARTRFPSTTGLRAHHTGGSASLGNSRRPANTGRPSSPRGRAVSNTAGHGPPAQARGTRQSQMEHDAPRPFAPPAVPHGPAAAAAAATVNVAKQPPRQDPPSPPSHPTHQGSSRGSEFGSSGKSVHAMSDNYRIASPADRREVPAAKSPPPRLPSQSHGASVRRPTSIDARASSTPPRGRSTSSPARHSRPPSATSASGRPAPSAGVHRRLSARPSASPGSSVLEQEQHSFQRNRGDRSTEPELAARLAASSQPSTVPEVAASFAASLRPRSPERGLTGPHFGASPPATASASAKEEQEEAERALSDRTTIGA